MIPVHGSKCDQAVARDAHRAICSPRLTGQAGQKGAGSRLRNPGRSMTTDPSPAPPGAPAPAPAPKRRFAWPEISEFAWRGVVFLVALTILVIITTRWNRWQGGARWQVTDDAYLQSDLTPLAAK